MTSFEIVEGQQPPMTTKVDVLVDSGTSQLILPKDLVQRYYFHVENATYTQGQWQVPCMSKLPTIRFSLQGGFISNMTMQDLQAWSMVGPPSDHADVGRYQGGTDTEDRMCFGRLQEVEKGGHAIFGLPVFSSHFLVFDLHEERIGFAEAFDSNLYSHNHHRM